MKYFYAVKTTTRELWPLSITSSYGKGTIYDGILVHSLVVGANETDQGIMTYLKGYGKRIWIPSYVFYLEGGTQKILVDTGLELVWSTILLDTDLGKIEDPKEVPPWCKVVDSRQGHRREAVGQPEMALAVVRGKAQTLFRPA